LYWRWCGFNGLHTPGAYILYGDQSLCSSWNPSQCTHSTKGCDVWKGSGNVCMSTPPPTNVAQEDGFLGGSLDVYISCFRHCCSKLHQEERMSAYKDFCKSMETQSVEACLMTDLRVSLDMFLYDF